MPTQVFITPSGISAITPVETRRSYTTTSACCKSSWAQAPTHLIRKEVDENDEQKDGLTRGVVVGANDDDAAKRKGTQQQRQQQQQQKKKKLEVVSLTPTMTQVKFLSLKNLGRLVADMASEREAQQAGEVAPATPSPTAASEMDVDQDQDQDVDVDVDVNVKN